MRKTWQLPLNVFLALLLCMPPIAASQPDGAASASVEARIARIENDFAPISLGAGEAPIKLNLQELMKISNVHGLSVAVFDNYKLDWAKGYGVTDDDSKTPITTRMLFQAASISKPVTAIAALELVQQGKLSLDRDVNLKLKSWKVPGNQYTEHEKVTLRRILTHTSGTTVHSVPGYDPGQPLPTLVQMLDGQPPATNDPVRVDFVPGTKERYSGGGVMIEQQLMTDVTGIPFPKLMQELVFDKLGLKDSTFEEPLAPSRIPAATTGHDATGDPLQGKWEVYPEMATAGLWTTPSDLGRIALEVARASQGMSDRLLSAGMAHEMLTLQVDPHLQNIEGGPTMQMGLGWMLDDSPGWFEHNGSNAGFRSEVVMSEAGHGVVVMANTDSFAATCVMRYLINNIAKEYGWKYRYTPYSPWPYADTILLVTEKLRGAQAAIREYYELKEQWAAQRGTNRGTIVWASEPPDYPPNEWSLLNLALTIDDQGHLQDAITIMKVETTQEYPKWAAGYEVLGQFYEQAGDKDNAIRTYEALLNIAPDDRLAIQRLEKLKGKN
jgi:CubicO group peptidase (beta-lactamase class C family)